jgi:hypothetical protein
MHADQQLLIRFAQWMCGRYFSNAASKLLKAAQGKSPMIGRHVKSALDNATGFSLAELENAFSEEERLAILSLVNAPASEITWEPSPTAARQRRRAAALDEAARRLGYESWRKLETAVVNGAIIRIEE